MIAGRRRMRKDWKVYVNDGLKRERVRVRSDKEVIWKSWGREGLCKWVMRREEISREIIC